jgi:hypothetical protein
MSLGRRLAEHFLIPVDAARAGSGEDFVTPGEAPEPACAEWPPRTPPGVAVLAAASDALALGAALGLALAHARRAAVAVVCVWSHEDVAHQAWTGPPLPAARRLAASLAARGHDARAAGRLAVVSLSGGGEAAAAEARRALAAAGAAPAVLALGGPRDAAFDALLADQDLVVVATAGGADPVLARLALAGLQDARRACVCEVPAAHPARVLAAAGIALLPSARRALATPVKELT